MFHVPRPRRPFFLGDQERWPPPSRRHLPLPALLPGSKVPREHLVILPLILVRTRRADLTAFRKRVELDITLASFSNVLLPLDDPVQPVRPARTGVSQRSSWIVRLHIEIRIERVVIPVPLSSQRMMHLRRDRP